MPTEGTRKLKVAIVSQPWGSVVAGGGNGSLGVWSSEVARRLARSCEVTVCAPRQKGQKAVEYHQRVRYQRFAVQGDRLALRLVGGLWRSRNACRPLFASVMYYPLYAAQVALALRGRRCDVAHIHNLSQFVPIIRALNPHIRIVLHSHCEWLTQLDRKVIARRLRQVDAIVGPSRYITDKIRDRFPEFAHRCHTVFNGVDAEHFCGDAGRDDPGDGRSSRILFVGRVSPEKGVHVLLDAFELVIKRYPQAELDIVGERGACPKDFIVALSEDRKVAHLASLYGAREYWSYLQERLASPQLRGRVRLRGAVPHRQLPEHYRAAAALINPSFSEAVGMTVIEAMAAQTAVVASRVGGMVDIIEDGKAGLLVEAGDTRALADAICRILSDGQLARSMGKAGRRRVLESFTWDKVTQNVMQLYENICDGGR